MLLFDVVAELNGTKDSGNPLVKLSFMSGQLSPGRGFFPNVSQESSQIFLFTGLSLDQAGFSTGDLKNICLMFKDETLT